MTYLPKLDSVIQIGVKSKFTQN